MKKLPYIFALPLILLLVACGPNNPLLGKWESEPMMGISSSIEFLSDSISAASAMGGMSTASQETKVKGYKIEKDKVGVVIAQGETTVTSWFAIVDADTIVQDLGIIKTRYHRKK